MATMSTTAIIAAHMLLMWTFAAAAAADAPRDGKYVSDV